MKKLLLISFFQSSNIGDNAICDILQKMLSDFSHVITMDISGKEYVKEPSGENKRFTENTKKCRFYHTKSYLALRRKGRFSHAERLIRECDAVLIAGGNMIMDLEAFAYYSYVCDHYVTYAKRLGKKVAFAYVGVGKIKTLAQMQRWKKLLMKCDMVTVRDALSQKAIVERLKCNRSVEVWKDPVFLLSNRKDGVFRCKVGVNIYLNAVPCNQQQSLIETYTYLIEKLKEKYDVTLFTTERADIPGLNKVYEALQDSSGINISNPDSLESLLALYQETDCVIATRMHSWIIATTQNIPAFILSWDKKIDGVLKDLDLSERMIDINIANEKKEDILKNAEHMMQNNASYVKQLFETNKKIRSAFDDYTIAIKEFLEE